MKNKVRFLVITGLIIGSFIFGISTGRYKHFPYEYLYRLYNNSKEVPPFLTLGRNFNILYFKNKETDTLKQTGIYLTYGQSNSTNSGEYGYFVKNEVFQFLLGETFVYEDPSLGVTGSGGSVWGMVGDKLIENGIHEQVVFSNCGWGGTKIENLKEGHYFEYLVNNYNNLIKKFGRVDGILFHQGEGNNSSEGIKNYYNDFSEFISNLNDRGINIPIYLSRVSLCGEKKPINNKLTNIQNQLIEDFDMIKEGPNTDLLSKKSERLKDYCHFSLEGYDKFSDMWVELLTK